MPYVGFFFFCYFILKHVMGILHSTVHLKLEITSSISINKKYHFALRRTNLLNDVWKKIRYFLSLVRNVYLN